MAWTAPFNGGSAITRYVIQRSTSPTSGWIYLSTTIPATARSFTATGLHNGTRYYFRLLARNAVGNSPWSNTANAVPSVGVVNCAQRPSSCGYPDATNTGVPPGTNLTVFNGNITVTTPGTVIQNRDIRGCVRIEAANVIIRRSRISSPSCFYAILSDNPSGNVLIEDVEINCQNTNAHGIGDNGITARRVNIHGCGNGFDVDNNFTVVDSYIHDLCGCGDGHEDGIQLAVGRNVTIQHNTIFVIGTSAVISHPTTNANVRISNNLFAGGAYTLYCPRDTSVNFRVTDNRFSTLLFHNGGVFGPWVDCNKVAVVSNNVWDHNLQPISFF